MSSASSSSPARSSHPPRFTGADALHRWVDDLARLTAPAAVVW